MSRCFFYHETDHLVFLYVSGTIDAFDRQYCINFSSHVAHMGTLQAWYFQEDNCHKENLRKRKRVKTGDIKDFSVL